jgi:hypothetical protein
VPSLASKIVQAATAKWQFRSRLTCSPAGQHSAQAPVPPKQ